MFFIYLLYLKNITFENKNKFIKLKKSFFPILFKFHSFICVEILFIISIKQIF